MSSLVNSSLKANQKAFNDSGRKVSVFGSKVFKEFENLRMFCVQDLHDRVQRLVVEIVILVVVVAVVIAVDVIVMVRCSPIVECR